MVRRKKRGTLKPHNSSIVIDLRAVLTARNISQPSAFLIKIGISNNSTIKLLRGEAVQVNMKQLTAICVHLNCTPNDIFVLREMELPENHALHALKVLEKQKPATIEEWLAGKTVEEIAALMAK